MLDIILQGGQEASEHFILSFEQDFNIQIKFVISSVLYIQIF